MHLEGTSNSKGENGAKCVGYVCILKNVDFWRPYASWLMSSRSSQTSLLPYKGMMFSSEVTVELNVALLILATLRNQKGVTYRGLQNDIDHNVHPNVILTRNSFLMKWCAWPSGDPRKSQPPCILFILEEKRHKELVQTRFVTCVCCDMHSFLDDCTYFTEHHFAHLKSTLFSEFSIFDARNHLHTLPKSGWLWQQWTAMPGPVLHFCPSWRRERKDHRRMKPSQCRDDLTYQLLRELHLFARCSPVNENGCDPFGLLEWLALKPILHILKLNTIKSLKAQLIFLSHKRHIHCYRIDSMENIAVIECNFLT